MCVISFPGLMTSLHVLCTLNNNDNGFDEIVIFLPSQTPLHPWFCVQVIMIECADLKNVINYQEVEALKHTIKVTRERGGWRERGKRGSLSEGRHRPRAAKISSPLVFFSSPGFVYHQVEGS